MINFTSIPIVKTSLPRQSQYWSDPCCTQWSHFSFGPVGLWSPHSCSLKRDTISPLQSEHNQYTFPWCKGWPTKRTLFCQTGSIFKYCRSLGLKMQCYTSAAPQVACLLVKLPVHVMMTSTCRMTSFSLTTLNPSMLLEKKHSGSVKTVTNRKVSIFIVL